MPLKLPFLIDFSICKVINDQVLGAKNWIGLLAIKHGSPMTRHLEKNLMFAQF